MVKDMALMAAECLEHPRRKSLWIPSIGKYVCPESAEALASAERVVEREQEHGSPAKVNPPLNPQFKLVFLTAALGTLGFAVLCVTLTLLAGREPPPLFEKVIMGFFDLAKIGFGAVVGLLGGKKLDGGE